MKIEEREEFGVKWIALTNRIGFRLELCSLGASIYGMELDGKSLLIGEKSKEKWLRSDAYFGKTIGRIAGRIRGYDLFYRGKHYRLSQNREGCTLHGGEKGFSFQDFSYAIDSASERTEICFSLLSPDLDNGFPGEVRLKVRYIVEEDAPHLKIVYESLSDRDTPLSLTSHCYFNLGGYPDVSNHSLSIDSEESTKYDEMQLPLGFEKCPAALRFQELTPLKERLDDPTLMESKCKGIDHAFRLLNDGKKDAVRLESPLFRLKMSTDFPSVVVYGDNYPRKENLLYTGCLEKRHSGIAIEPEYEVGDYEAMTSKGNETKSNFIDYRFERKEKC